MGTGDAGARRRLRQASRLYRAPQGERHNARIRTGASFVTVNASSRSASVAYAMRRANRAAATGVARPAASASPDAVIKTANVQAVHDGIAGK